MTERVEHSAGPWNYCKPHKRWLVYPKSALNDGIDYFIAEAINVDGREQEAKANARLIAACPDLLAALKALQLQALQSTVNDPANEWGQEALELTRAALSRATGEA